MVFSLMFMMVSLSIQLMVWTVRLTFVGLKITIDLIEALVALARH